MGLFSKLIKKTPTKSIVDDETNYIFTERDREISLLRRQTKQKQKTLIQKRTSLILKKEIMELDAEIEDLEMEKKDNAPAEQSLDTNSLLTQFMTLAMNQKANTQIGNPQTNTNPQSNVISEGVALTDDTLRDLIKHNVPAVFIKRAKKMADISVHELIKTQYPRFDDETITRAVKIIKE